jgi:hypothetical protein
VRNYKKRLGGHDWHARRQLRKKFFFEKKNQKTFALFGAYRGNNTR